MRVLVDSTTDSASRNTNTREVTWVPQDQGRTNKQFGYQQPMSDIAETKPQPEQISERTETLEDLTSLVQTTRELPMSDRPVNLQTVVIYAFRGIVGFLRWLDPDTIPHQNKVGDCSSQRKVWGKSQREVLPSISFFVYTKTDTDVSYRRCKASRTRHCNPNRPCRYQSQWRSGRIESPLRKRKLYKNVGKPDDEKQGNVVCCSSCSRRHLWTDERNMLTEGGRIQVNGTSFPLVSRPSTNAWSLQPYGLGMMSTRNAGIRCGLIFKRSNGEIGTWFWITDVESQL